MLSPDWLRWPETQKLISAFSSHEGALRFVGGAVRDAILGRVVHDVDAATCLLPDEAIAVLERAGIRAIPTGIAHGTVTALVGQRQFEITTLRKDVACDGRHAEVVFTDDWKEDASRRDFTMNAMYLSPSGELFDFFGGQADATTGRVRFIGDAAARVAEDYLRVLRFFRFFAHYGQGEMDAVALAACAGSLVHLQGLSGERVQAEMLKLFDADAAGKTLLLMEREGILSAALGVDADAAMFVRVQQVERKMGVKMPAVLNFVAFVWQAPELWDVLSVRLRLSGKADKSVRALLRARDGLGADADLAAQKHLLRKMGSELFVALVILSEAAQGSAKSYHDMAALAQTWSAPAFPVSGEDLIARGIAPGKAIGDALRVLETSWEQSDYMLDAQALLSLLPKV